MNPCPCCLIFVFARSEDSKGYSSPLRQSVAEQLLLTSIISTFFSGVLSGGQFAKLQVMELRGLIGFSNKVHVSGSRKTFLVLMN